MLTSFGQTKNNDLSYRYFVINQKYYLWDLRIILLLLLNIETRKSIF